MSEVKTDKISSVSTNGDITLDPDGTGDVVVSSGHKLGIGTTSPALPLEVNGSTNVAVFRSDASNSIIQLANSTGTGGDNGTLVGSVGDDLYFRAGDAERMRITSSGNVGVGTTSPSTGIHANKSSASSQRIRLENSEGYADFGTDANRALIWVSGNQKLRLDSGGELRLNGEGGSVANIDVRQGSMKAWLYAASNATFYDTFNISSSSDQGTGNYDYNFSNNMNNANYSITCNALYAELAQPEGSSRTTSKFTVRVFGRQDSISNQDQGNAAQIGGDLA
jgi:hypothetical protein